MASRIETEHEWNIRLLTQPYFRSPECKLAAAEALDCSPLYIGRFTSSQPGSPMLTVGQLLALLKADVVDIELINKLLSLAGAGGAYKSSISDDGVCYQTLMAEVANLAARLADMLRDGRVDHLEEAELSQLVVSLFALLSRVLVHLNIKT